ncbi:MAG: class I SAM-dependent methyltransferase [Woeseiaceae bacterium]|nr:class I SAM-dependent methyltransferase [Woeseiaceae bacterium]
MNDQDYWERHARNYDASMRWVLGRPIPRLLELAAEAVRGKDNVLEVAAGTGIVTTAIAQTCESVEATDYASAMIEELRERVRGEGLDNVNCAHADIYSLPYQADTFDAVVAANVLHLVPDLSAALAALRQVTKPGGMLVAPTFCHDETRTSWLLSRLLAVTSFPVKRRFTLQSLGQALQDNGLRVGHLESLPGLIPIGYVEAQFQ